MSTTPSTTRRSNLALAILGLGAFVVGTAELVIVGILNLIAEDMQVSISTAGQLVTAYALGISLGGPLLTALTIRFGRRFLLCLSLVIYIAGNLLAVLAVNFGMLVAARIVTGSIHGLFIGVAFMVAASLVPPERQGQAMSMVFGGIAVSTVLGVPLGTLIGQALSWQAAFVGIVVLGVIALVLTLAFIPAVRSGGAGGFTAQARAAFAPRVLAMLGVGFLLLGGQFTALTYLSPYLEDVTGISGEMVSVFLLAFGIATAVGTFVGGKAADRSATTTLIVANILLVIALGVLYLVGATPVLVALTLGAWGLVGFGLVPSLQLRVITLAGAGGDLAATLGASAVNAGIATGAIVGGWAVASQSVKAAVVSGLVICAVALPATWAARLLKVPAAAEDSALSADVAQSAAAEQTPERASGRPPGNPSVASG
jgi:DHA1 family inner membrane transport protein